MLTVSALNDIIKSALYSCNSSVVFSGTRWSGRSTSAHNRPFSAIAGNQVTRIAVPRPSENTTLCNPVSHLYDCQLFLFSVYLSSRLQKLFPSVNIYEAMENMSIPEQGVV